MPKTNYFEAILELSKKSISASNMLNRIINEFHYEDMKYLMVEMEEIEHEGDIIVHDLKKHLITEFMLPIKREDIFSIAESIDSILDTLETIAQYFYMYSVKELRHEAKLFSNIISEGVNTIYQMLLIFQKSTKIKDIQEYLDKLDYLEDKADTIYINSTKDLFKEENDIIVLTQWDEIISQMEKCCDRCKNAGVMISKTYLKNK